MRVVNLASFDTGGAAIAAHRLHRGLRGLGIDSRMVVANKSSLDETVQVAAHRWKMGERLRRRIRSKIISRDFARYRITRSAHFENFSDDRAPEPNLFLDALPKADLYNLHWVAGFLDYRSFFARVPRGVPLVWTLHDMNPFTGGCHYTAGCDRFAAGCGACPALGSTDNVDLSAAILRRKRTAYSRLQPEKVRLVAPSRWLSREASRSALFRRFEITTIPYGLDTEVFRPRQRAIARAVFGIPQEKRIVMFSAQSLASHRKGLDLLIAALDGINRDGAIGVVSVGNGSLFDAIDENHFPLGELNSERLLSFAYSTADVFVSPSREDNLPNVLLEAMACGTPTVAFEVGGIPDIVRSGATGLLAKAEDVRSLRHAIMVILSNDEKREALSRESRRIALQEYRLGLQAERYRDVYRQLLEQIEEPMPSGGGRRPCPERGDFHRTERSFANPI
jgi:glycosyltransferase involved in cell wall biosynthesis